MWGWGEALYSLPQSLISDENAHTILAYDPEGIQRIEQQCFTKFLPSSFAYSYKQGVLDTHIQMKKIGIEFILNPSLSSIKQHSFTDTSIAREL